MPTIKPDSAETQRLLERAEAGDPEAPKQLLARHDPFLRQVVELRFDPRLRARVDPSDVVQEARIDAFRRLADYLRRRPMPFRLWLRSWCVAPPPHRTDCCRPIRWREGVKGGFACTLTRHFDLCSLPRGRSRP